MLYLYSLTKEQLSFYTSKDLTVVTKDSTVT